MSSTEELTEKVRQQLEHVIRVTYREAWHESRRWPNHPFVDVSIEWDGDRPLVNPKPRRAS